LILQHLVHLTNDKQILQKINLISLTIQFHTITYCKLSWRMAYWKKAHVNK